MYDTFFISSIRISLRWDRSDSMSRHNLFFIFGGIDEYGWQCHCHWMGIDENGWKRSSHHHWGRGHFVTFSRSHQLSASSIILVSNIITNIMIISNNPDDCDEDVEKGALCRSIHPGRPHRRAAHPRQPGGPIMLMMSLMIMMMIYI